MGGRSSSGGLRDWSIVNRPSSWEFWGKWRGGEVVEDQLICPE